MEKIIIVGGGVAGLSCLNALLDRGVDALLVEAGIIGSPKMCGEFLAPAALKQLQQWQIGPLQIIHQAHFYVENKQLDLAFTQPGAAYPRENLELQLAARARRLGGRIQEQASIHTLQPATLHSPYVLTLATGEVIEAKRAIFATGKLGQQHKQIATPYYGLKIHFPHIVKPETLLMYSEPGAYFGIVPVTDKISNCTCLATRAVVERSESGQEFMFNLFKKSTSLQTFFENVDMNHLVWQEAKAPEFELKNRPDWPHALWIGDAFASLHPAIGYGFAHSVTSAVMAAEACLHDELKRYHSVTLKSIKPKMRLGKLLHKLMLNPYLGSVALPFLQVNPKLMKIILHKMGYC